MANLTKMTLYTLLALIAFTSVAEAIAINRCTRILRDAAGRETVLNGCKACVTVTVERTRPGQSNGTPNVREYNIPGGTHQPLSFRGPGLSRIAGERACPVAGAPPAQ